MGNASLDDKFLSIAFTPFILSVPQKHIPLGLNQEGYVVYMFFLKLK